MNGFLPREAKYVSIRRLNEYCAPNDNRTWRENVTVFRREWTVRFSDTDRFGIAFYPQIIEEIHDTADRFMEDVGWPLWELPAEHGIGLPIVEVRSEFDRMLRSGDVVVIELCTEVSTRSTRFRYTGSVDGDEAFTAFEQRVCVDVDDNEPVPIPDDLCDALATVACD